MTFSRMDLVARGAREVQLMTSREKDRKRIARETAEFLARGGRIEQVGMITRTAAEVSAQSVKAHMNLNDEQHANMLRRNAASQNRQRRKARLRAEAKAKAAH